MLSRTYPFAKQQTSSRIRFVPSSSCRIGARVWGGALVCAGTPAETATATETAAPGDIEALKVENAILREKIEKMEAQVEKLRKALQELI